MKFCRTEKTEAELRRHWLPAYGRTLEIRSLEVRWAVWGCCSPLLLPAQGRLSAPPGSRPLFPRCVREVGPLASRLPRRHLTGHGEVWGDQGSPQLFLASVCSELDWRLAEQTKQQLNFSFLLGCHFGGVSVCVWGCGLCNQGRVPRFSQSTRRKIIFSSEVGLYPQLPLCSLVKGHGQTPRDACGLLRKQ